MYGLKYTISFKNRIQNDIYRCEIWQKDFGGDNTDLTGAAVPFTATYQDGDILEPIKPVELTLSFFSIGLGIMDFYSDDDEEFRIDFYFDSGNKLLYTGYLIEDGVNEPVTDRNHALTLKATDNLALLKNVKWNEAVTDYNSTYTLNYYIKNCLKQTGLYSHDSSIDMSLPLRVFSNLFETTTDKRTDADTNDPFEETALASGIFQNNDGTYTDCYEVLTKILTGLNATLLMADGFWNIIRTPEYRLFADGAILGTEYDKDGSGEAVTAVTLAPLVNIARTGGDCFPINEDQLKAIQRPFRYVKDTFNYQQPGSYIIQNTLQLPAGATPYDTETVGDLRYDRYTLASYFPFWTHRDGDTSYLEVVTDVSLDPENEVERYIVVPSSDDTAKGIEFNPIAISAGDIINFTAQMRTLTNYGSSTAFWVRMVLITDDGNFYTLARLESITGGVIDGDVDWFGPYDATLWDTVVVTAGLDRIQFYSYHDNNSQWMPIDTSLDLLQGVPPWKAPVSGMLLIEMMGANLHDTDHVDMCFKDIVLNIQNFINTNTLIVGQTHLDTGISTIKAVDEEEVSVDDSPRNSIAGTLFTDALSNFDYTDTNTSEQTNIGDIYFTRTRLWQRSTIEEAFRLGHVITQERLIFKLKARLTVEGTFANLRYDNDKFISLLSFFNISFYSGSHFLAASLEIDYMSCTFRSRLVEIYNDADIVAQTVFLFGDKNEQLGLTNGNIQYDTINYFNGADVYLTPSLSNSRFTYNGFDTNLELSAILFVPISGSGTAQFDLLKNGVSIATQTLPAAAHFGHIDFLITESVTTGDYFEVSVDTGGADVDIQSGSINITVDNVISFGDVYQFNYLYKTQ